MVSFYSLPIKTIKKETSKAVSIEFEVPQDLTDAFKFKAGQYVTLKANINGSEVRRDYSICTNPNEAVLKVVVKEVENGVFSTYANQRLKNGDVLEVAPPNGRFVLEGNQDENVVLFAAGSGITPVMSILKTVLSETSSKVLLVYGNKSPEDTIFRNNLIELQKEYINRFNTQFVYSQFDEADALFGRIDKSVVNFTLKNKFSETQFSKFYLCGPEEMINTVKSTLVENGIDTSNILYELFTASASTEGEDVSNIPDGNAEVTVLIDDEEEVFVMSKNKTILEAALEVNIDAPYSCQGGVCSSCLAKITKGKAEMRVNNILTDDEIEEGFVLTCQAQPLSDTIYVDYDDV